MPDQSSDERRRPIWMLGLGVVLGASVGTIYGAGADDLVAGVAWGVGMGIAAGGILLLVMGR